MTTDNPVPPYIPTADIGRACSMTTEAALGMIQRAGIATQIGGRWYVGESRLREALPEMYDRVLAYFLTRPDPAGEGESGPGPVGAAGTG